jgi:hypothetical protein
MFIFSDIHSYPTQSLLRFLIGSNSLDLILDFVLELWSAVIGISPLSSISRLLILDRFCPAVCVEGDTGYFGS